MTDLIISSPLADRLRSIAERENRSVEDLLASLLNQYQLPDGFDEVDAKAEEFRRVARRRLQGT